MIFTSLAVGRGKKKKEEKGESEARGMKTRRDGRGEAPKAVGFQGFEHNFWSDYY